MPAEVLLSLHPNARVEEHAGGAVSVVRPTGTVALQGMSRGARVCLERLREGSATEDALAELVDEADGSDALVAWYYVLESLRQASALCTTVMHDGTPCLRVVPLTPMARTNPLPGGPEHRFVLSRFACIRRIDRHLVLTSPLALARVELLDPAAMALPAALASPGHQAEIQARCTPLGADVCRHALQVLDAAGLLARVQPDGVSGEDADPVLAGWSFEDLVFHARSRAGWDEGAYGATFPQRGIHHPLPAVKPPMSETFIALERPDLHALSNSDPPFTRVLELRQSLRTLGETPITLRALGDFLYRSARVRALTAPDDASRPYEASSRPYPGGGACHEIELYLVVRNCSGLSPGLYHYDPLHHRLEVLKAERRDLDALWPRNGDQQVLVIIATRFARVNWKYDSMAYSLVLKDAGCLMQTMYLVATAMELAPCAAGGGDARAFSRATGLPMCEESSIGEFVIGSREY